MTSRQALAMLEAQDVHLDTNTEEVLSQTLSQMSLEHEDNPIENSGIIA